MPSFFSNELLTKIRNRKGWAQENILYDDSLFGDVFTSANISRIENMRQVPMPESTKSLLGVMKLPAQNLFVPYFENQTPNMLQQRDQLLFCLLHAAEHPHICQQALTIADEMESTGKFTQEMPINRQFILHCKTALWEIAGQDPAQTMKFIKDAIALTYPEYDENTFRGDMLIFNEADLLLTKAKIYKRGGDLPAAIRLLERMANGLNRLPQDDREKEQIFAPVLLTLAQCCMQNGDYQSVLMICNAGHETSLKRNKGFYLPDFAHHKAICLAHLGQKCDAVPLARQAYFGYTIQRRNAKAADFFSFAKNELNIPIQTYGAEALQLPLPQPNFVHAGYRVYETFGQLLDQFRIDAGLSMDQLCEGICAKSTLDNIINGRQYGSPYVLEALMQRLGRDVDKYINTFIGKTDFENKQKRDAANALLASHKYSEAEKLLQELENEKHFTKYVGRQFLELGRARIYGSHSGDSEEYRKMLEDVVCMTNKKFDLRNVNTTRLTYHEIIAVNRIANSLCNIGEMQRGMRLQEALIDSMDIYYGDGAAKMRMYTTVLYNYTKNLGLEERYKEAFPLIDKGEDFTLLYGQFKPLPGFAASRAYCLFETGEKEKSLTYHALSYYCDMLIEKPEYAKFTKNDAEQHFNVIFD